MRSARTVLWLGLSAFVALVLVADAQATIYFVNPNGNDKNTGTSVAAPFRTIAHAAKVIRSGDTVYVAAGTYTDAIVVNGIQGLNLPAVFIGNSGATVNAQWKVVNCNYLQIKGFAFQDGGADRLLVWKGSYEGLVQDCTFDAGGQGLLINSGSLTIEDSQITNFEQDGIQVDGEARLLVRDSKISGCQASGLEIRKAANVALENCEVKDNLGTGVEVSITTDSIDPGPDGSGPWLTGVPLAGADGPVSLGGNGEIDGDLYVLPQYTVDPSKVSGTIHDLPSGMSFPPADPEDAAINNDNAGIPKTDKNKDPLDAADQFSLNSNDGIDLPPGTYYFTNVDCKPNSDIRISGPTIIFVAGNVLLKGDVNSGGTPGNLHIYVLGTLVDITSQAVVKAGIYAPDATIKLRGGGEIEGMILAGSIDMAGGAQITTHPSLESLARALLPGPPSSPLPPASWEPVSSGELEISGSEFTHNGNGIQVLTEQQFISRDTDFSNNDGWGLLLCGVSQVEDCTLNNNAIGGVRLQGIDTPDLTVRNLTLADNTQYGIFAVDCGLTFDSTNIGDWVISGSQIAIMGQASDLAFDQVAIGGGSVAAVQLDQGNMKAYQATFSDSGYGLSLAHSNAALDECTFTGNTVGLYANQNQSLLVKDSTLNHNSVWGAVVHGGGSAGATTLEACTIDHNPDGLSIVNAAEGQVLLRAGTVLRDNTNAGLHFDGCNLTLNDQAANGWQITNNNYGISSENSTLRLDRITSQDNNYGAWLTSSNVTITNSKFSGGTYGLWATNNNSLSVDSSVFSGNSSYGVYLDRIGSLRRCSITGNGGGLYLNTANVTDFNLTGTDISGNTGYGIYSYQASLDLVSQSVEGWSIDGNGVNVAGYEAAISLTGATMTNATNYGVHAEYGSLNLQQSNITSNSGGVCGLNTTGFTVDRSHISGAGTGKGLYNLDGGLTMRNSVVSGAQYGVYSDSPSKLATIYNTTIADVSLYGLYVDSGDLTVMNTIISGSGGTCGLYREPGAIVTHSYNLVSGFAVGFANTPADASESLATPLFVDAAHGDYRLAKGSPAINAGTDLSASGVFTDMLGNARPSHKVSEIGAYEYMQDGGSLRVLNWKEDR